MADLDVVEICAGTDGQALGLELSNGATPTPMRCSCCPGRPAVRNCPLTLARKRGERHENMYVTMLELGNLNL